MTNMFGQEAEHAGLSRRIFHLSWQPSLDGHAPARGLITGFSCLCQIKRFAGFRPAHLIEPIFNRLEVHAA